MSMLRVIGKEEMKEIALAEMSTTILEEWKEKGREEGEMDGEIKGIIITMKEFGKSWDEIWVKIKSTYRLTLDKTQEYMDMYW